MKKFETPTIEIERFTLQDAIAVSLESGPDETTPIFTLPEDEFGIKEPLETI